jgi:hypothetical protein
MPLISVSLRLPRSALVGSRGTSTTQIDASRGLSRVSPR